MPKSKDIAAYPSQYLDILSAGLDGQPLTFTLASRKEASAFRFNFYGFRRALEAEGHPRAREAKALTLTIQDLPQGKAQVVITLANEIDINLVLGEQLAEQMQGLAEETFARQPMAQGRKPPTDEEIAQDHDETDSLLVPNTLADEQADLIKAFFSPDTDPEDLPEAG